MSNLRDIVKKLSSEKFEPLPYGFAILLAAAIFLLNFFVEPYLGREVSYLTLLIGVVLSSWYFGFGPGLLTTELITLLETFFFRDPLHLIIFLVYGFLVSLLAALRKIEEDGLRKKEEYFRGIVDREKEARAVAEEAVKTRDEFLSIASHELKTPLTTILLQLQSTLNAILNQSLATFSGEKLVNSLTVAQQQSNRLQKLIKDLLNVSLISTGRLELELKKADLSSIVQSTLSRFDDKLMLEGCTLNYKSNGQIVGLWDEIRLEQAISNLITNAIKYGKGKPIDVTVDKSNNFAKITVADQGIGIDPSQQKQIFERFKRAASGPKYQGLGVGLFIVKQIVESHEGKVSVKSRSNQGSSFSIELPIKN